MMSERHSIGNRPPLETLARPLSPTSPTFYCGNLCVKQFLQNLPFSNKSITPASSTPVNRAAEPGDFRRLTAITTCVFIYVHPRDHYLSIQDHRDVIELPVNTVLDINGWDLRKALRLFWGSNATLYEWLQSPVVYRSDGSLAERLRHIAAAFFSLRAGMHHYQAMVHQVMQHDLQGAQVRLKAYFYAVRPQLAASWIAQRRSLPPMELRQLLVLLANNPALLEIVQSMLQQKSSADEKTFVPRSEPLHAWLQAEHERCAQALAAMPATRHDPGVLNDIYRSYLV